MNLTDMTNYDLVNMGLWATFSNGVNDGRGRNRSAEHTEITDVLEVELLRRLDEADALRKENEELRKDKKRLDCFDNLPKNAVYIVAMDINGKTYIVADSSRPIRESIDAARLAKESEASHE